MAEKADRRKELADVMDEAVRWFQMALKTGAAVDARAYLDRRGLNSEALQQFEIGFAPNDRAGLKSALMGRGISEQPWSHYVSHSRCTRTLRGLWRSRDGSKCAGKIPEFT